MVGILLLIGTSLFIALLVVNLFFRIKLLKLYKKLVEGEVDFPPSYILDRKKLESEIVPKYPKYEKEILAFSRFLKTSFSVGMAVFVLSLLIGYQILKNR